MENTTGLVIKGLREKYGYTQEKLATFLSIERENISFMKMEKRKSS